MSEPKAIATVTVKFYSDNSKTCDVKGLIPVGIFEKSLTFIYQSIGMAQRAARREAIQTTHDMNSAA